MPTPKDTANEQALQKVYRTLESAGRLLSNALPAGSVFTIFVSDPQGGVDHLWVPDACDPDEVKEMLRGALKNIEDPERIIGSN